MSPSMDDLRRASTERLIQPHRRRLDQIEAEIRRTWRGRLALRLVRLWARWTA